MTPFDRLSPYIQDYVYRCGWTELREIQVAACEVLFESEQNLLLSTGTASGKTEAAFLPVLTLLHEKPSHSVGVLYISPLKALINDQFVRLEDLLAESGLPVCKWHGDAPLAAKTRLLKHPAGVLQITPESLQSLLIHKRESCMRLFSDLRYLIIDEVHYFMDSPRGTQLLCLLEQIEGLAPCNPRRIGLSATLGDYTAAERWLCSGSPRTCITPLVNGGKRKLGLSMQRFVLQGDDTSDAPDTGLRAHYAYLYSQTLGKKSIIFTNSRAEAEQTIANIRELAAENHTPDVYRVHHGSISAALREEAELDMKQSDRPMVVGATVTLELGIDIGSLDRVVQIGAPVTVSSFTQRIGRCGRRGQPAELLFTFVEEAVPPSMEPLDAVNWEFLKTIAIIQLYLEEKWVEPIAPPTLPYALLYHQTMCFLLANGEMPASLLAQNMLRLSAFRGVSQEDYKCLLRHLLAIGHLQKTERGGLLIGVKAEPLVNHYGFYTVFEAPVEYLVKKENESIGTVMQPFPPGVRFALAGRTWVVVDRNESSKILFVKETTGISKSSWISPDQGQLHTRLLQRMFQVLREETVYAYLSPACKTRLAEMRKICRLSGVTGNCVTPLGGKKYAIFPWLGTRPLFTLLLLLEQAGISGIMRPNDFLAVYLEVHFDGEADELDAFLRALPGAEPDLSALSLPENIRIACKYNDFVPQELLTKQFLTDYLDWNGLKEGLEPYVL